MNQSIKLFIAFLSLAVDAMMRDEKVAKAPELSLIESASAKKMGDMVLQACSTYEQMRVKIQQLIADCEIKAACPKEDEKLSEKDKYVLHARCCRYHAAYTHYVDSLGNSLREYVDNYQHISSKLKKLPGNLWYTANSVNSESKRMLVLKTAVLAMQVQQVYIDSLSQSCRDEIFQSFQEIFARYFLLGGLSAEKDTRETKVLVNEDVSYSMCRVVRVFELYEKLEFFSQARELALVRDLSGFSKSVARIYRAAKNKFSIANADDESAQLFDHITQKDYERLCVFIICVQPGESFEKAFSVVKDLEGEENNFIDVIERYYIHNQ